MNEQMNKFLNDNKLPLSVGLVSFVAGVGTGLLIGHIRDRRNRRDKEPWTDEIPKPEFPKDPEELEAYIAEREKKFGIVRTSPEKAPEEELVEVQDDELSDIEEVGKTFLEQKLEENAETEEIETTASGTTVIRRQFASSLGPDDDWNYDEELAKRSEDRPFIIHKDEFYENEHDYSQITLTYYSGDDILVDEDDSPIYSHNQVVGELKFGHGSGDPNVVYVRNDKRRAEYEVLFDPGLYSVEVLGLSIEDNQRARRVREDRGGLKHSGVPKFRTE
jgi:hypothetical protein